MCRARNLLFGCTPFYVDAIVELRDYVDYYKVASYQLLHYDLLNQLKQNGKRVVLSTGMAQPAELVNAYTLLRNVSDILHCVSGYPAPIAECNLRTIDWLRTNFRSAQIGYSDHSVSPAVLYAAVLQHKAHMVEFHLDIDGQGDEFHVGHCWLPEQIKEVIDNVRLAQLAEGNYGKFVQASEVEDRLWRSDEDGLRPLKGLRSKLDG